MSYLPAGFHLLKVRRSICLVCLFFVCARFFWDQFESGENKRKKFKKHVLDYLSANSYSAGTEILIDKKSNTNAKTIEKHT